MPRTWIGAVWKRRPLSSPSAPPLALYSTDGSGGQSLQENSEFQLTRLERRFYGLPRPPHGRDNFTPQEIRLAPKARHFLEAHTPGAGVYRGGPLFGTRQESVLTIDYATVGTLNLSHPGQGDPLAFDPVYVMGYSNAHRTINQQLDWVGHWMSFPDGVPDDRLTCFGHLERAERLDLIDLERPMLFLTYQLEDWTPKAFILRNYVPQPIKIADFDFEQADSPNWFP